MDKMTPEYIRGKFKDKHFKKLSKEQQETEILILNLETLEERKIIAKLGDVVELSPDEVIVPENQFLGKDGVHYHYSYNTWVKEEVRQHNARKQSFWNRVNKTHLLVAIVTVTAMLAIISAEKFEDMLTIGAVTIFFFVVMGVASFSKQV